MTEVAGILAGTGSGARNSLINPAQRAGTRPIPVLVHAAARKLRSDGSTGKKADLVTIRVLGFTAKLRR